VQIQFYAHACFRLESPAVAIVTDPYTPGPGASNFTKINEPADIVIMSSAVDRFHSDPTHILGDPDVVNAVEVPPEGVVVRGVPVQAFRTMESSTFDYGEREAQANAMYWFELDGVRCFHMGDLGNAVSKEHVNQLRGKVDVMFALTGGEPTISLPDLVEAIEAIGPRVVIPMHYYSPTGVLQILPVESFTELYPTENVTWMAISELTVEAEHLPDSLQIYVLQQSR
jgi:L-ascorbate metabolism protein UlaG (beta-lactamase superfamily)